MRKYRSWLGNKLFKLAAKMYEGHNPARRKVGNKLFKLAATVSPNKVED